MSKLRRATITTPATDCVVNVSHDDNKEYDRRRCDEELTGAPVLVAKNGSGSIEFLKGQGLPDLYDEPMVVEGEEVAVVAGEEVITTVVDTYAGVTMSASGNWDNESGQSGSTIGFTYTDRVRTFVPAA